MTTHPDPLTPVSGTPADARSTYTFTVFTPTFDRAHTLGRVYESLVAQTLRDFEWLIVDDGSTDRTAELVAEWQAVARFPIRYVSQANQGKHVAFNRGVALARGELFLTHDSDDGSVPEALERLKYHWDRIPPDERPNFCSVTGLCVDQHGRLVGDSFPQDVLDSDPVELLHHHRVRGEKWGFVRTDVLRRFPFPVAGGMEFVPESIVWDMIGEKYRTRYVNEVLRVYWIRPVATAARLCGDPASRRSARGLALWHGSILDRHLRWFRRDPAAFVASAIHYARFSALAGDSPFRQSSGLRHRRARLLWALCLPFGYLLAARDALRSPAGR